MEISGLPLHPLVVHAAVVLTPLAALAALGYAVVGRWRERLRWPMVALAVAATLAVLAAFVTGNDFLAHVPALAEKPLVQTHHDRARLLLWLALGFGLVAVVAGWLLHAREGAARVVVRVLLVVAAAAVLVQVVLTGDAGSRAVWEGILDAS